MNNAVPVHAGIDNIDYASSVGDPKKKTLNYYIDESAERFADSTAIKFDDRIVSYQTLVESANQLSRLLMDSGVKKGNIIGLAVDRVAEVHSDLDLPEPVLGKRKVAHAVAGGVHSARAAWRLARPRRYRAGPTVAADGCCAVPRPARAATAE